MRLIDADKLELYLCLEDYPQEPRKYCFPCREMFDAIKAQPTIPSAEPERKKPIYKSGESVCHVSYADGTGGFEVNKWADWTCPECGWFVGEQYIPRHHNQQKCNYCARCGCAIDWSDADMRGEEE